MEGLKSRTGLKNQGPEATEHVDAERTEVLRRKVATSTAMFDLDGEPRLAPVTQVQSGHQLEEQIGPYRQIRIERARGGERLQVAGPRLEAPQAEGGQRTAAGKAVGVAGAAFGADVDD